MVPKTSTNVAIVDIIDKPSSGEMVILNYQEFETYWSYTAGKVGFITLI